MRKGKQILDIEHKLDLIQKIHREQEENERYIYKKDFQETGVEASPFSSFRFRLLVSILLFLCFFIMDKKEIVYGEINSSNIVNHISSNIIMEDVLAYLKIETD